MNDPLRQQNGSKTPRFILRHIPPPTLRRNVIEHKDDSQDILDFCASESVDLSTSSSRSPNLWKSMRYLLEVGLFSRKAERDNM